MSDLKAINEEKKKLIQFNFLKFKEQNKWFDFHKDCLQRNIGKFINIPDCYEVKEFSDIKNSNENFFVLKSTIGFSSKEVLILCKNNESYYCLLNKKNYTVSDINNFISNSKSKVICEQYLGGLEETIPMDYKCYMFNGKVKYVLVINRSSGTPLIKYFHPETYEPIELSEIFASKVHGFVEDPKKEFSKELTKKIQLAVEYAQNEAAKFIDCSNIFLSLDFYVTSNQGYKVWLGEITPKPGILEHNQLHLEKIEYLYSKQ